jgi:hypothetical protein
VPVTDLYFTTNHGPEPGDEWQSTAYADLRVVVDSVNAWQVHVTGIPLPPTSWQGEARNAHGYRNVQWSREHFAQHFTRVS